MSEKFYVGLDVTSFEDNGKQRPISRVTLMLDDNEALTAGDNTGVELVADCPHATQEMVNASRPWFLLAFGALVCATAYRTRRPGVKRSAISCALPCVFARVPA